MNTNILKACDVVGGQTALAKLLTELTGKRVTQQRVRNWLYRDDEVPSEFGAPIETATHGEVTRQQMWPENWMAIWPELVDTNPGTSAIRESQGGTRQPIDPKREMT